MNDINTNGIPCPLGQGIPSSQSSSPGGPAENRPPTNEAETSRASSSQNASAPTQETVPREQDEQDASKGSNPGLKFFETKEEIEREAAKNGRKVVYDVRTGRYRMVDPSGRVPGVTRVSKEYLQNYKPPQENQNGFVGLSGPEMLEFSKKTGAQVLYDPTTGELRFADASGRPFGLVDTTAVDRPPPEASGNPGTEAAKSAEEPGSLFNNEALGKVEEPPSALTVQPPPPGQSLAPMPTINRNQLVSLAKRGKGQKPKITPAMLKDKVIRSCILIVKDGVVYRYNGICYQPQDDAALQQLVIETCRAEVDENGYFDLVTGTIKFIRAEPMIQYTERVENQRVLTFQNGNLDIETWVFGPHTPEAFTTYALKCCYIPDPARIACPEFDQFLWGISGGDAAIIARLWEMLGYCLVPDIGGKTGFVLQGRKHTGKSLLCNFLEEEIFPDGTVSRLDVGQLSKDFAPSELKGKVLCMSGDMPDTPLNSIVVSNIKKLVGNDVISAPIKYKNNVQFRFGGKFILVTNHQLCINGKDDAFEDRLVAIPFPYSIPKERWDTHLKQRFLPEKDSIVSKAIGYYWGLKARHYIFSGSYQLNSGAFLLDNADSSNVDMGPLIKDFLLTYFEPAPPEEAVFMADAHAMFVQMGADIPLNQFGGPFGSLAVGLLGAKKSKTRKEKGGVPLSCLKGLRVKGIHV